MNRNWKGWLGIGLGALALLIALSGWGFGSLFAGGFGGVVAPQVYTQQSDQSQNHLPQSGRFTPSTNAGGGRQRGDAVGQAGKPSSRGFSFGKWFGFAFKLFEGLRNLALIAVLALLAVLLLRGRGTNRSATPTQDSAAPPRSPTGESYVDESDNSAT